MQKKMILACQSPFCDPCCVHTLRLSERRLDLNVCLRFSNIQQYSWLKVAILRLIFRVYYTNLALGYLSLEINIATSDMQIMSGASLSEMADVDDIYTLRFLACVCAFAEVQPEAI